MTVRGGNRSAAGIWRSATVLLAVGLLLVPVALVGGGRVESFHGKRATIVSPCEGFFLINEYPGGEPLVMVGSPVSEQTIVGYVQSMDRTAVRAGVVGTVAEILAKDMTPVSAGDALFDVEVPESR